VADSHRIHLVVPPQPPKPKPIDPASIAAEVLTVVRSCEQFLTEFRYYQERLADELGAQITELELSALRNMTGRKGRAR
jgi:hypothetical protein